MKGNTNANSPTFPSGYQVGADIHIAWATVLSIQDSFIKFTQCRDGLKVGPANQINEPGRMNFYLPVFGKVPLSLCTANFFPSQFVKTHKGVSFSMDGFNIPEPSDQLIPIIGWLKERA